MGRNMNGALTGFALTLCLGLPLRLGLLGEKEAPQRREAPSVDSYRIAPHEDLSKEVVATTMARFPTGAILGPWEYTRALFLLGELAVYERTHDARYLTYAKEWADEHVTAGGEIDHAMSALDFIMPADVTVALYRETGEPRYKLGSETAAGAFKTYPRTADGAFWHSSESGREHQIWLDGSFMGMPFLVAEGSLEGHRKEAATDAARQLLIYATHLRDAHGRLYFHAYDESGQAQWANPATHQSPAKWGRSIGWFAITLVTVLNAMPDSPRDAEQQEQRRQLTKVMQNLARDLVAIQDPVTGLWFEVPDKPTLPGNFLESSSSSMFTYFLESAIQHRYIDASYEVAAQHGYNGVLSMLHRDSDGRLHIEGICEGTVVGDESYYLSRKVHTDDLHGLGAFLLMNEELQFHRSMLDVLASRP